MHHAGARKWYAYEAPPMILFTETPRREAEKFSEPTGVQLTLPGESYSRWCTASRTRKSTYMPMMTNPTINPSTSSAQVVSDQSAWLGDSTKKPSCRNTLLFNIWIGAYIKTNCGARYPVNSRWPSSTPPRTIHFNWVFSERSDIYSESYKIYCETITTHSAYW